VVDIKSRRARERDEAVVQRHSRRARTAELAAMLDSVVQGETAYRPLDDGARAQRENAAPPLK
jgi:hypothetical protein